MSIALDRDIGWLRARAAATPPPARLRGPVSAWGIRRRWVPVADFLLTTALAYLVLVGPFVLGRRLALEAGFGVTPMLPTIAAVALEACVLVSLYFGVSFVLARREGPSADRDEDLVNLRLQKAYLRDPEAAYFDAGLTGVRGTRLYGVFAVALAKPDAAARSGDLDKKHIDHGTLAVTDEVIAFRGSRQTRDWPLDRVECLSASGEFLGFMVPGAKSFSGVFAPGTEQIGIGGALLAAYGDVEGAGALLDAATNNIEGARKAGPAGFPESRLLFAS